MCCRSEGVQQIWIVAPSYAATTDCYARLSTKTTSAARLLGEAAILGLCYLLVSYTASEQLKLDVSRRPTDAYARPGQRSPVQTTRAY